MLIKQHEDTKRLKEEASLKLKELTIKERDYELAVDLMKKIVEGMSQSQINHLEVLQQRKLNQFLYYNTNYLSLLRLLVAYQHIVL